MFDHLEFQGFRGFAKLSLPNLGRVNLVVGRNNCGKTSLLEGITLLCDPKRLDSDLPGLLRANIGAVQMRFDRWVLRDGGTSAVLSGTWGSARPKVVLCTHQADGTLSGAADVRECDHIANARAFAVFANRELKAKTCRVVSVQQRDLRALNALFGRAIEAKDGEGRLEQLLKAVDSRVRKVRAVPGEDETMLMVDLGLSEMLPLSQAGQGLSRLLSVFCELVGHRPKVCLIDEIENGIHHTVLPQVWKGVDAAARDLGIQVFATTHSHECIEAAHEAFVSSSDYGLRIVQLYRVESGPQGRVLDREHIEAALAGNIELR